LDSWAKSSNKIGVEGGNEMRTQFGLISTCALAGLLAAAVAHAQPASPNAAFDGTYRLVSSTKVNPMYTKKGVSAPCPDRRPGPLTIAAGAARYTTASGYDVSGAVGPRGELALKMVAAGDSRPLELDAAGGIDANGKAYARQRGPSCSYDFVWQK
jgi:hypothetical protein